MLDKDGIEEALRIARRRLKNSDCTFDLQSCNDSLVVYLRAIDLLRSSNPGIVTIAGEVFDNICIKAIESSSDSFELWEIEKICRVSGTKDLAREKLEKRCLVAAKKAKKPEPLFRQSLYCNDDGNTMEYIQNKYDTLFLDIIRNNYKTLLEAPIYFKTGQKPAISSELLYTIVYCPTGSESAAFVDSVEGLRDIACQAALKRVRTKESIDTIAAINNR